MYGRPIKTHGHQLIGEGPSHGRRSAASFKLLAGRAEQIGVRGTVAIVPAEATVVMVAVRPRVEQPASSAAGRA